MSSRWGFNRKRRLDFRVTLVIHELTNYPHSNGFLFVKWTDKGDGQNAFTRRVAPRGQSIYWNEQFDISCKLYVNNKTNMIEPHIIHLSVRQESPSGFERVGTVDVDLAEYVGSRMQVTRRYLLRSSAFNSVLEVAIKTQQTTGDPMFRSPDVVGHTRASTAPDRLSGSSSSFADPLSSAVTSDRDRSAVGMRSVAVPSVEPGSSSAAPDADRKKGGLFGSGMGLRRRLRSRSDSDMTGMADVAGGGGGDRPRLDSLRLLDSGDGVFVSARTGLEMDQGGADNSYYVYGEESDIAVVVQGDDPAGAVGPSVAASVDANSPPPPRAVVSAVAAARPPLSPAPRPAGGAPHSARRHPSSAVVAAATASSTETAVGGGGAAGTTIVAGSSGGRRPVNLRSVDMSGGVGGGGGRLDGRRMRMRGLGNNDAASSPHHVRALSKSSAVDVVNDILGLQLNGALSPPSRASSLQHQ